MAWDGERAQTCSASIVIAFWIKFRLKGSILHGLSKKSTEDKAGLQCFGARTMLAEVAIFAFKLSHLPSRLKNWHRAKKSNWIENETGHSSTISLMAQCAHKCRRRPQKRLKTIVSRLMMPNGRGWVRVNVCTLLCLCTRVFACNSHVTEVVGRALSVVCINCDNSCVNCDKIPHVTKLK